MTLKSLSIRLFVVPAAVMILSGCSGSGFQPVGTTKASSSENILDAEGPYELVEQTDKDPEAAHKQSRNQVNPTQLSKSKSYTGDARTAKVDEEVHTRVLKMERDVEIVANEFKGLKNIYGDTATAQRVEPASGETTRMAMAKTNEPVLSKSLKTQGGTVENVRTGEYPNRTRLVIDLNAPAEFAYDIDKDQNLLVIRLSATDWAAAEEKRFDRSSTLQAYAAKISDNGQALVAFKLKGPSKVLRSEKLGKNADGYYRIFFDIAPI